MPSIFVEIPVDDEWPDAEIMTSRNAIIDELERQDVGEFGGAGGGMGTVDFSFSVLDVNKARAAIERAMQKHLPGRAFSVDVDTEDVS